MLRWSRPSSLSARTSSSSGLIRSRTIRILARTIRSLRVPPMSLTRALLSSPSMGSDGASTARRRA